MNEITIAECIGSMDPLSDEALGLVVSHAEEDGLVDYKEDFDPSEEKQWLEIAKDVMAFANTGGGYLVFGVTDSDFEVVGIKKTVSKALLDVNMVHQKLNRHFEPEIGSVRAKSMVLSGSTVVVWHIPESKGITHSFNKDGEFKFPSGDKRTVFRKGTFYVRRSAGNHLADSRDIDMVFGKRLNSFREQMLGRIAQVVEAPAEKHVLLVTPEEAGANPEKFIIDDAPDAIPIKGMSFTVSPSTPVQEVAGWIAMSQGAASAIPPKDVLWSWYRNRVKMKLSEDQRISVSAFCILRDVPCFYWLAQCTAPKIRSMIIDLVTRRPGHGHLGYSVNLAMFIGKRFHASVLKKLGDRVERLDRKSLTIPGSGPKGLFNPAMVDSKRRGKEHRREKESAFKKRLEKELNKIIDDIKENSVEPPLMARVRARAFDCYLYARNDRYARKRS